MDYLSRLIEDVSRARGTLGGLAVVGLLWTGMAVFAAVRKGINHAWHIGMPHYFLLERFIDLVMLLGVAVLALVQVALTTDLLGLSGVVEIAQESGIWVVFKILFELIALLMTFGAFLLLYRYVPNTKVLWRDIWIGALVGSVLFQAVRLGFAWFISGAGTLDVVYGSLGAFMAVLVWAYLSAMAIMMGAQLAYTYSGVFGSNAGAIPLPEPRRDVRRLHGATGLRGVVATVVGWLLPPKGGQR